MESHELRCDGLVKRYRRFTLGPLDAAFGVGVTALLGANGAGKSTLIRLAVGTDRPSAGSVSRPPGRVGFLPQDFRAPGHVRVADYLRYVAWCRSSRGEELTERDVVNALDDVGLADRGTSRVRELSGGMHRRLGFAQAVLGRPALLCLDEPTVGLDVEQRRDLRALVTRMGEVAIVLLSTHMSEDVAIVASRCLVLSEGSLRFGGSTRDLVARGAGQSLHAVEPASAGPVTSLGVERGYLDVVGARYDAA